MGGSAGQRLDLLAAADDSRAALPRRVYESHRSRPRPDRRVVLLRAPHAPPRRLRRVKDPPPAARFRGGFVSAFRPTATRPLCPAMNAQLFAAPQVPAPFAPPLDEDDRRTQPDAHLAPLNYWLPGELTVQPLFFDRLELPHEDEIAP